MPIYEYRCEDCGLCKEHLQKLSDEPIGQCPGCAGTNYKKQLSAAGFQLKGTGWYATDFKGSPTASKSNTGGKETGTAAAGSDGQSSGESSTAASGTGCGTGCACH